ncbi:acyltransferase [Budviciaceae bacterium BWR-B9]|uniref:Acyltransferase n=1 Tax=Limnobaculum allomyrinae TaxID=2791986 RepID=A0ABS1IP46_9GAMM|nr:MULTISPECIES: acyltransferase family protein [Limnobaculum]MBK5143543.1 acyltransferase [Limnobaculum allomyrinae]MBV7691431.1 acyltransferase family protein [Limnobaculum sp. M2-1]
MTLIRLFQRFTPIEQAVSHQLDMLRGFSTAMVLFCHAYLLFLYPVWPAVMLPVYLFAHAWVMALFALSGFLICKSACYNIQQNHQFSVKRYAFSRLNRIVPPFYFGCAALLFIYLISPWFFASGSRELAVISDTMSQAKMVLDVKSFTGVLLFVNGFLTETPASNFSFWSLPFEVWFYVLFGLLLWPRNKIAIFIAVLLLLVLSLLNYAFLLYSLIWCGGAIAALLHNHQRQLKAGVLITLFSSVTIVLLLLAAIGLLMLPAEVDKPKLLLALYGTLCGIGFGLLFYLMSFQRIRIRLPGYRLARSSYTIYILHFPLLLFIYGIVQPYIYRNSFLLLAATWVIACAVMLLGLIVGRYIERLKPFP